MEYERNRCDLLMMRILNVKQTFRINYQKDYCKNINKDVCNFTFIYLPI